MPIPFLVRFVHDERRVCIDVCPGPLVPSNAKVAGRARRISKTYLFLTWESSVTDHYVMAEFRLKDEFFDLAKPPETLRDDLRWFSREVGIPELASIDVWSMVQAVTDFWGVPSDPLTAEDDASPEE